MFAIEPVGLDSAQKELWAVCVGASVGHGQDSRASVLELEVLISELFTVDRLPAGAVSTGEVAALSWWRSTRKKDKRVGWGTLTKSERTCEREKKNGEPGVDEQDYEQWVWKHLPGTWIVWSRGGRWNPCSQILFRRCRGHGSSRRYGARRRRVGSSQCGQLVGLQRSYRRKRRDWTCWQLGIVDRWKNIVWVLRVVFRV